MYFAIIDCGTTNSRVYLVDEKREIIAKASEKVGVVNVTIEGSNRILKEKLSEVFLEALKKANIKLTDVSFAITSGAITSEIGLLEIPHLLAPVSIDELARNVKKVRDKNVFPLDVPMVFVRGVKTVGNIDTSNLMNAGRVDFMRGEETQVAGFLSTHECNLPLTILFLTSHTMCVSVNSSGEIAGSVTTLSGQVYEAIVERTVIGKSIRKTDDFDNFTYFDTKIIEYAHYWVTRSGFLRGLLMPRLADVLLRTKWYERKLFLEATIAVEDMRTIAQLDRFGFSQDRDFVIMGKNEKRCRIYKYLLQKIRPEGLLRIISNTEDIDMLTINGAIDIARRCKLFE
ncbi:2-dehydro-3-deoxygalactonokinase [Candidatus Aerophobetes bacterium]|nr:2-dehydro-3-deoxygalactonokinase [Candidatus Aerophobetes bacterium]